MKEAESQGRVCSFSLVCLIIHHPLSHLLKFLMHRANLVRENPPLSLF